jgi:DNA primase
MPDGEDPDTLVLRGGAAAIEPLLHDAIDVLERKLQLIERKGWFSDVGRRREALDRLLPTVRAAIDPVTRELYLTRIAQRLEIPREVIAAEAAALPSHRVVTPAATARTIPHRVSPRRTEAWTPGTAPSAEIERKLLRLLLSRPQWLDRARGEISPERFAVPAFRQIYDALVALPDGAPVGDALASLDERAQDAWGRLIAEGLPEDGFDLDREYVGALEALEEMQLFPDIVADPDPMERTRRKQALSPEGQNRYQSFVNARRRRQPATDESHARGND